uniref:Putative arsenate reductase n=1 Tax=Pteris vittata TaxID=13821 RepID=Q0ZKA0_PTEVI|nr:putative arsenate reductase [Pteris vittata]
MARAFGSLPTASAEPSAAYSSNLRLSSISGEQLNCLLSVPKSAHFCRTLQSSVVVAREANADNGSSLDQVVRTASLALLTALSASSTASPALAVSAQDITNALLKVQDVTQKATNAVGGAYGTSKDFIEQLFTTVKPAVDAATPYVQKATDAAVQVATPLASDVVSQADKALKNAGLDTRPVVEAAKTAVVVAGEAAEQTAKVIEGAKPVATSTLESIISADPLFIAGGAGALLLLYLLTPSLLSSIAYTARGYKGDLSAAQVLDLLSSSNYVLIDVRTEKEKAKSGLPSLPRNVKNKYVPIPLEELPGKLKGQLRNSRKLEAEITAIKISFLKRIGRGSNIVVLDSFGGIAKSVAKSLAALGFKNAWVVSDGFDGGKGWVQSRLGTDSFNSSFAEVLSPSRIIPAGTKKLFKTTSSEVVDVTPRFNKLLPGGYE